jgi:hypothetical protein
MDLGRSDWTANNVVSGDISMGLIGVLNLRSIHSRNLGNQFPIFLIEKYMTREYNLN